MRQQPSTEHTILYIYLRVGLPMRVLNEEGEWRYVEDHEGKQGWMHRSVLSSDRMFRVMTPTTALYTRANANSAVRAEMEVGVVGSLLGCQDDGWCRTGGKLCWPANRLAAQFCHMGRAARGAVLDEGLMRAMTMAPILFYLISFIFLGFRSPNLRRRPLKIAAGL